MSELEAVAASARDALQASQIPMDLVSITVDDVDDSVVVKANGPTNRDGWDILRDSITHALDAHGVPYKTNPQWAFVEVTAAASPRTDGSGFLRASQRHKLALLAAVADTLDHIVGVTRVTTTGQHVRVHCGRDVEPVVRRVLRDAGFQTEDAPLYGVTVTGGGGL